MYAKFSAAAPPEWASSAAGIDVVEAVPFMADADLENANELKGNIALVSRGECFFVDKVKRVAEAGATGVIVINIDEHPFEIPGNKNYKSDIPVLMIKSGDGARLREQGSTLIRGKRYASFVSAVESEYPSSFVHLE